LKDYRPVLTLLGHIHKQMDDLDYSVYYVGSPCGLDITETGKRRYLILDTETLRVESVNVDSEVIYFDETIVVYPRQDEEQYLRDEIKRMKEKWGLTPEEKSKTQLRINVTGYSSNKRRLKEIFDEELEDYSFWKNEGVNVSKVSDSDNQDLERISKKVFERIHEQNLKEREGEPTEQEILSKAIQKIYSEG
jgi:exonuclease SbcD